MSKVASTNSESEEGGSGGNESSNKGGGTGELEGDFFPLGILVVGGVNDSEGGGSLLESGVVLGAFNGLESGGLEGGESINITFFGGVGSGLTGEPGTVEGELHIDGVLSLLGGGKGGGLTSLEDGVVKSPETGAGGGSGGLGSSDTDVVGLTLLLAETDVSSVGAGCPLGVGLNGKGLEVTIGVGHDLGSHLFSLSDHLLLLFGELNLFSGLSLLNLFSGLDFLNFEDAVTTKVLEGTGDFVDFSVPGSGGVSGNFGFKGFSASVGDHF